MNAAFADRLTARIAAVGPLCLGLDPFPGRIPALFGDARQSIGPIHAFFTEVMRLAPPHAACLKLQLGLFEPFGADGVAAAQDLIAMGQSLGLPIILDAKRGDIGTTAEGYAAAALDAQPGMGADAVTVNPYMGLESLEPFFARAESAGKGVAVLVRTSNPGAQDFQALLSDGKPIWMHVAQRLAPIESRLMAACGWSNLMVVAGATAPTEAKALRAILPRTLFLVPGYGAQGASAAEAMAGLPVGQGGVVNASRAALYPAGAQQAANLAAWRDCLTAALAGLAKELRAAGITA
jgi:orotidine-5'-phosphate decarboxylase